MRFDAQTLKRLYERQLEAAATPGGGDTHHGTRTFRAMLKASRQAPARQLDGERIWIWSDLHLGHDNIIGYANRPFRDAEEMDEELYANWYATVGVDDTLIFAGDVAMRDAVAPHTWQRIRTAPGKSKRLVFGNHDLTGAGTLRVDGFDDICSAACIDGDPPLLVTHMPLAEVPAGCVNVHGHTHDEAPRRSPHINVSVIATRLQAGGDCGCPRVGQATGGQAVSRRQHHAGAHRRRTLGSAARALEILVIRNPGY